MMMLSVFFQTQTNTELLKVFQEHKHNLDLLTGPSEGLIAALPSLNIIDSKFITSSHYKLHAMCFVVWKYSAKGILFCFYVIDLIETCLLREGRVMRVYLIGLSSLVRCILSCFWVCLQNKCVLFCFISAPIDDGAVQRLRDLIVSLAINLCSPLWPRGVYCSHHSSALDFDACNHFNLTPRLPGALQFFSPLLLLSSVPKVVKRHLVSIKHTNRY